MKKKENKCPICGQETHDEIDNFSSYLNRSSAAKYLGIPMRTLIKWEKVYDGKIPFYKHPMTDYPIYKIEDLKEFLKSIKR